MGGRSTLLTRDLKRPGDSKNKGDVVDQVELLLKASEFSSLKR